MGSQDRVWTRRELIQRGAILAGLAPMIAAAACSSKSPSSTSSGTASASQQLEGPLNLLAWDGYDNPEVLQGFKDKYGVDISYKYHGGDPKLLSLLQANPEQWDVVNPDNDWVGRLAQLKLIQPLQASDYPHVKEDYPVFQNFEPFNVNGEMYAVPTRFGFNAFMYNDPPVTAAQLADAMYMWDPSLKGKVSMVDWFDTYIPLVALYMGNKTPENTTGAQLDAVTQKLIDLKPNITAIHQDRSDIGNDLANKQSVIGWAGGTSDLSTQLDTSGVPVKVAVPDQGGLLWTEGLCITAATTKLATCKAYLDYMTSAEVLAKMAWNDKLKIQVVNPKVENYLTPEQFSALHLDEATQWLTNPNMILQRQPTDLQGWEKAWEQFKSA